MLLSSYGYLRSLDLIIWGLRNFFLAFLALKHIYLFILIAKKAYLFTKILKSRRCSMFPQKARSQMQFTLQFSGKTIQWLVTSFLVQNFAFRFYLRSSRMLWQQLQLILQAYMVSRFHYSDFHSRCRWQVDGSNFILFFCAFVMKDLMEFVTHYEF